VDLDWSKVLNCHIAKNVPQKCTYMTPTLPLKKSKMVEDYEVHSGAKVKRRVDPIKEDHLGCVNIRRMPMG
jgi:hypothetical protein